MKPGPFIVLEGLDGAGTTTQMALLQSWLERTYRRRVYTTHEPSNGPVGMLLRLAIRRRVALDAPALALLFAADRLDHLQSEVTGKLQKGIPVLCDRYYLSSFAYQWSGMPEDLEWLEGINAKARRPDLTILIDTPAEVCMERIRKARWETELFEEAERLQAVRANYLSIVGVLLRKRERIEIVDGNRPSEAVHTDVCALVKRLFEDGESRA
jgi:dTMP kinase